MKVKKDDAGIYIQSRLGADDTGGHYRPGGIPGYDHVYDMSDGGLVEGDNPKTHHVSGAPLVKITLESGRVLYWATTEEHESRR